MPAPKAVKWAKVGEHDDPGTRLSSAGLIAALGLAINFLHSRWKDGSRKNKKKNLFSSFSLCCAVGEEPGILQIHQ